jgi:hypothetical protein
MTRLNKQLCHCTALTPHAGVVADTGVEPGKDAPHRNPRHGGVSPDHRSDVIENTDDHLVATENPGREKMMLLYYAVIAVGPALRATQPDLTPEKQTSPHC